MGKVKNTDAGLVEPAPEVAGMKIARLISMFPKHHMSHALFLAAALSVSASAQDQSYVTRTSSLPHTWTKIAVTPRFLTAAMPGRVDYNPVFSPDGKLVLFERGDAKAHDELFIVPTTGGEPRRLSPDSLPIDQSRPNWSPTNNRIAFTGCTPIPPSCGIWIINGDGTNAHRISVTGTSNNVLYPSWYPDGRHLAVMDASDLITRRVDIATGATEPATDHSRVLAGMPSVSPDGKWIAFAGQKNEGQRYNQNRNNIWLVDQNGNLEPLEADSDQGRAPTWSPDGDYVAFESYRGSPDHYAIFVVKRDGTGLAQVTNYALNAQHPSWSRDGHQMTFAYQAPTDPNAWGIAVIEYPKIP